MQNFVSDNLVCLYLLSSLPLPSCCFRLTIHGLSFEKKQLWFWVQTMNKQSLHNKSSVLSWLMMHRSTLVYPFFNLVMQHNFPNLNQISYVLMFAYIYSISSVYSWLMMHRSTTIYPFWNLSMQNNSPASIKLVMLRRLLHTSISVVM